MEWYYDDVNNVLKMYSTDSPTNHDIKFSSEPYALSIDNEHYLIIQNIEFKGGYSICADLYSCSNLYISNCIFGENANFGVYMGAYKVNGANYQLCDNIVIDRSEERRVGKEC